MILYCDWGGTYFRYTTGEEVFILESRTFELFDFLDHFTKSHPLSQMNISFAGQVQEGIILSSPNVALNNFAIKQEVEQKYNITLLIENDLKCAALAEANGRKGKNIALIYAGTGLGGAFFEDRLLRGADNFAGEIGHIPYQEAPYLCGCGNSNCLELFCSGSGIKKRVAYENLDSNLTLGERYHSHNPEEKAVADDFISALTYAGCTVLALLNPRFLTLGGGILDNEPWLFELVKKEIYNKAFSPAAKNVIIEKPMHKNSSLEGTKLLKLYR
ncbi:MAG: ROK family protein [Sulfuricurvum sp.]